MEGIKKKKRTRGRRLRVKKKSSKELKSPIANTPSKNGREKGKTGLKIESSKKKSP
jgi:hypothetical protein